MLIQVGQETPSSVSLGDLEEGAFQAIREIRATPLEEQIREKMVSDGIEEFEIIRSIVKIPTVFDNLEGSFRSFVPITVFCPEGDVGKVREILGDLKWERRILLVIIPTFIKEISPRPHPIQ
jgi:hypothetical protein